MSKTPAQRQKEYRARKRAKEAGGKVQSKQLPDYGVNGGTTASSKGDTLDLASDLPSTNNALALNIAEWPDLVTKVDADGYKLIRSCLPVVETIEKLARRTAKLNWVVMGEGARAEAVGEIFEQSIGLVDAIIWLTWAKIEGYRIMQIKSAPARKGSEPWIIPDFFMGGRLKEKAGGEIAWDGRRLVMIQSQETNVNRLPELLPYEQFIIHRPGAGSNPEGDSPIGVVTYNAANKWIDAMKSIDAHMELYSVPMRVLTAKLDGARPGQVQGLLNSKAEKLRRLKQNKEIVLTDQDMISLLEPKGKGFVDMVAYAQYLEGLIDQLFLGNTLTSKTNEGGRTGDTSVHADQQDDDVLHNAMQIAESFNRHLVPWIISRNPTLPELEEGEFEPYLWPTPPEENEDLSVDVEDPDMPSIDTEDEGEVDEDGNPIKVDPSEADTVKIPEVDDEDEPPEEKKAKALRWAKADVVDQLNKYKHDPSQDAVYEKQGNPPLYMYVTMLDDRVRPNHASLQGFIITRSSFERRNLVPPNGFNCRCQLSRLDKRTTKEMYAIATERLGSETAARVFFDTRPVPAGGYRDIGFA